jgi:NAD(P)H dehydrogenase (quinone)
VGYDVLQPHVAYGVEAGARYSDAATIDARLQRIAADWASNLEQIADRPTVPFNKMAHWGADGHITPDAPAHSAFMRQNQHLTLE